MINLVLFPVTVLVYFGVLYLLRRPENLKVCLKRFLILALLCLPININDNVITILGNAVAEKSVVSVCSIYQKAGENAVAFLSAGYQEAGEMALAGISAGYQEAGRDAVVVVGFAGCQKARKVAEILIGLAGYQKVGKRSRTFAVFSELKAD